MLYGKLVENEIVYFIDSEIKLNTIIIDGNSVKETLTDELRNQYLKDNGYKEVVFTRQTASDISWVESEDKLTQTWTGKPIKVIAGSIPVKSVKPEKLKPVEKIVVVPTNEELRKKAYATEKLINFENKLCTVDQANLRFLQLLSEGRNTTVLQNLISEIKNSIRLKYQD